LLDCRVEVDARRADGTLVPVELTIWALEGPTGWEFNALLRDITERRRHEDELRHASEELERSNADLAEFAYVAAHDLKSPLNTIMGFADLLVFDSNDTIDDATREYADHIRDGGRRMQSLVDDLLTYCQAGTSRIEPAPVDLAAVATEVLWLLDADISQRRAALELHDLPVVAGDRSQLRQVLQNLLANSLKFSRPDTPPVIEVTSTPTPDGHLVEVADNGIGIPPEHHSDVFAMFSRHARSYEGTGIGLAICHRIIERHGGRIWAEDNTPSGTRMRFTLPTPPQHKSNPDGYRPSPQ
jgi:signal transduction histidine kinase